MLSRWDVYELEIEQQDPGDPSIDGRVGLNIWVVDHSLDILGIDFHIEVTDSYQVKAVGTKSPE